MEKIRKFTRDQPEVRRRQLIEATLQCLAELGHAGTSVRAVCARAGVSPGLVTHHFEGIDDLIAAAYAHVGDQVAAMLDEAMADAGGDPLARLRAFIDTSFRAPMLNSDLLQVWLAFWSLVRRDPRIRAIHADIYGGYRRSLEKLVGDIAETRKLNLDVRLAVLGFTAMMDGLWLEYCLDPTTFTAEEASRIAHGWIDTLIEGGFNHLTRKPAESPAPIG
ncbi:TetR/AcrR family transcriptional regulator [Dongia soli]|uniref:TetR family transcriptional regulator C-terminal domain-containing protein n=1 Tax=Dongia soli TaxID=600628 RepID=A0ABU5E5V6_9PROT|nr:TetR family transcriptional regulator C-terminal domain-containing protein [Dongia soli]MDY0881668.1 TetR family transcriptional regulator C-terminal domain-containing protein [Dongia soli]